MNGTDWLRTATEAAKARRAQMRTLPPQVNTISPDRISACYMRVEAGQQCGCFGRYSECRCGNAADP